MSIDLKKAYLLLLIAVGITILESRGQVSLGSNPSGNHNYIRTTTYLQPSGTIISSPTTAQVMQEIDYYDGLGRRLQLISVRAASNYNDVVTPIEYDAFGREAKKYKPYATVTNIGGAYKTDAFGAQPLYYQYTPPAGQPYHSYAYSMTEFESSPLNRVLKQGASGQVWQPASSRSATTGRSVDTEFKANNEVTFSDLANTRKVGLYQVAYSGSSPLLIRNGDYAVDQLHVTVTKDENWETAATGFHTRLHTTEEYTDKLGRVVLKRTFNLNEGVQEMLSTYYVYDDFGNLAFVLSPGTNPDRDTGVPSITELNQYAYQYRYDDRNRMSYRRLPGADTTENYIYNTADWLVLHQEARQHSSSTYDDFGPGPYHTFYKYDAHGRVIMKGVERGRTSDRETIQNSFAGHGIQWERRNSDPGHFHGYTNLAIPFNTPTMDVTEVNYYDTYEGIPGFAYDLRDEYSKMTQGLLVAQKTKVLGTTDTYLLTVNYYNDRGELVRQFKQHYATGQNLFNYDDHRYTYTFTGQLKKHDRYHYIGPSYADLQVYVFSEYDYDHRNRLMNTWKSVGSLTIPAPKKLISRNEYNEMGQVRVKRYHSEDEGLSFGYHTTYEYNERGWSTASYGTLFEQYLKYADNLTGVTNQYNGNISRQEWRRNSGTLHNYTYSYDGLNRLVHGSMPGLVGREALRYDKMGNITYFGRTGTTSAHVDTLTYTYAGNRLTSIADGNGSTDAAYQLPGTTAYTYDGNGNVTSRINSGSTGNNISNIVYNYLNLPKTVMATVGNSSYIYDGSGRKLRSTFGGSTTNYVDGIEWVDGNLNIIHHEEGRIVYTGTSFKHDYFLRDHLGNNRSGFADASPTVLNFSSDYYPFGLQHQSGIVAGMPINKYLYNGKEFQGGLKQYDYGARLYDPVIGRWGVIDPLAENYQSVSPYTYVLNNPMIFADYMGLDTVGIHSGSTVKKGDVLEAEDGSYSIASQDEMVITARPWKTLRGPDIGPVSGFLGHLSYYAFGRHENGFSYNKEGKSTGLSPIMGYPGDFSLSKPVSVLKLVRNVRALLRGFNQASRIRANTLKEFKSLVNQLSRPDSELNTQELRQLEKLTQQFGGRLRYDLNPIKGKILKPHVQVEGLGQSIQSRHIWLAEGVR